MTAGKTYETVMLKGKMIVPGIILGRVCLYNEDILDAVPRRTIPAPEIGSEKERIRLAMEETRKELRQAYDTIAKKLNEVEAGIFGAHLMILEDRSFVSGIEERIDAGFINAEAALVDTIMDYEKKFKDLPVDFFRERINDIKDIAKRILNNFGIKHSGFMCACPDDSPAIIAAEDLTGSLITGLGEKKVAGILIEKGSFVSHGAVLARAMGIPVVIGIKGLVENLSCNNRVLIDADDGLVYINPDDKCIEKYSHRLVKPEKTLKKYEQGNIAMLDGTKIKLLSNASNVKDIKSARKHGIYDVGLLRTEFVFMGRNVEPDIDEQVRIYRELIEATEGVITFRLLDIGGDKILNFISMPDQENPGLGLRGVRIYESYPEIIQNQIKAILIAKGKRQIRLMIPMVSTMEEFVSTRSKVFGIYNSLGQRNSKDLSVGCMIEIPSAVYLIEHFIQEADFLSIGTNDLIQYVMGVDRANTHLEELADPFQPAVMKVLKHIIDKTKGSGKEVTVCGEIAGDPFIAGVLAGMGYRYLSINPYSIAGVGERLSSRKITDFENEVSRILEENTLNGIKNLVNRMNS